MKSSDPRANNHSISKDCKSTKAESGRHPATDDQNDQDPRRNRMDKAEQTRVIDTASDHVAKADAPGVV